MARILISYLMEQHIPLLFCSPFPCDYPREDSFSQKMSTSAPQLQCLWLLMQSLPPRPGIPVKSVAVPIHIDNTLADFVVKVSTYDQGTRKRWKTGERFRMFFGGKASRGGQGGVYYKGTVVLVEDVKPGELYDPWESIMVEWDNDSSESPLMKVNLGSLSRRTNGSLESECMCLELIVL